MRSTRGWYLMFVLTFMLACLWAGSTIQGLRQENVKLTGQVSRVIPNCPEDEVLLGTGDFDAGQWTSYKCGPARDSYVP